MLPTRSKLQNAPILPFVLGTGLTGVKPGTGVKLVASASWADPNKPEVTLCTLGTDACIGTIRGSMDFEMNTTFATGDVVNVALFAQYIHEVRAGSVAITAGSRVSPGAAGAFFASAPFSAAGAGGLCVSPGIAIDDCPANGAFGLLVCPVTYPC
jgi:hypothetical protein